MPEIQWDIDGFPVMLADVTPSGVAKIDPNAKSGNDAHDTRSGKFAAKAGGKKRPTAPANVDRREFARMRDAVREAARAYAGNLNEENLMSFIAKRAANPGAVNIQQFMQLVQQQQLDDIVDVLHSPRSGPKLSAPRGYLQKVLAGATDDDVAEIIERLQARGIKDAHVVISKKLPRERREVAQPVEASLGFEWVEEEDDAPAEFHAVSEETMQAVLSRIDNQTPPIIEFKPEIRVEVPRRKRVPIRDERGLLTEIIEVDDPDG